jgi:hypothetical protein
MFSKSSSNLQTKKLIRSRTMNISDCKRHQQHRQTQSSSRLKSQQSYDKMIRITKNDHRSNMFLNSCSITNSSEESIDFGRYIFVEASVDDLLVKHDYESINGEYSLNIRKSPVIKRRASKTPPKTQPRRIYMNYTPKVRRFFFFFLYFL